MRVTRLFEVVVALPDGDVTQPRPPVTTAGVVFRVGA
jgi:hypothetical protein